MGKSFAMGNGQWDSGPHSPGKREEWGMPPPPVTSWSLTIGETPE